MVKSSRESDLRAAFERLKSGEVTRVARGTAVTQNNIARETGIDPSAFKKSRYPLLIDEIQRYCLERDAGEVKGTSQKKPSLPNPDADELVKKAFAERDLALSKLMLAQVKIIELTKVLADYEIAEQERLSRTRPDNLFR